MSNIKSLVGFPLCGLSARPAASLPNKFEIQRAKWKIQEVVQFLNFLSTGFRNFDFLFLTFALLLVGCAETQRYEAVEQISAENINKIQAMQTAEEVLAKMHFTIEKADAESGLIRTAPLPGAQFFEFWRSDSVGAFNCAEANLHSIRRIAQVNVRQQDEGLSISCEVNVFRLSLPEHEVSSSARAYEMFSESSLSLQKIKLNPEQEAGMAWVNLGRDGRLETEILKRISSMLNIDGKW